MGSMGCAAVRGMGLWMIRGPGPGAEIDCDGEREAAVARVLRPWTNHGGRSCDRRDIDEAFG